MKILMFFSVFLLCSLNSQLKKVHVKDFAIGKFYYSIYEESHFSHDDNWNAAFFVVRRLGKNSDLCSSYITAKRNDSTFIKGMYSLFNNRIEFTECYYFIKNTVSIDSMKTIFYPNKYGDLILRETIQFKNGKTQISINK
jgi:hypothetical protein